MANDESVLREVDQELAEDRQWAMFQKYGPAIIGAAIAIVIGVGAWQFWNARQEAASKRQALEYRNAIELLDEDAPQGRVALDAIAGDEASGYSVLAQFRRAGSFAAAGEREAAIAGFKALYQDSATPKRLRELARVRAAYQSLADGRDAVLAHLGDLPEGSNGLAFHAMELSALAALEAGDYETALSTFRRLSIDLNAPEAVRTRAEEFAALAASGKAGVNISGDFRIEDLVTALEAGEPQAVTDEAVTDATTGDAAPADENTAIEPAPGAGDNAAAENEATTDAPADTAPATAEEESEPQE